MNNLSGKEKSTIFTNNMNRLLSIPNFFFWKKVSLLATPLDVTAPADGVPGLIGRAIDLAYEELSDGNHPRLYQPNVLPELHDLIVHEGISRDASTSWRSEEHTSELQSQR